MFTWSAFLTTIAISFTLSLDAFSVSVVDGLTIRNYKKSQMVFTSFMFGLFQALFPLIGFLLGLTFMDYIKDYDHWVALILLSIIGLKMIIESIIELRKKVKEESCEVNSKDFSFKLIIVQAIATAIDAFAVGISLESSIAPISPYIGIAAIGIITFLMCILGSFLGKLVYKLFKGKVEIASIIGGTILILIGVKIVLEHLGVISF